MNKLIILLIIGFMISGCMTEAQETSQAEAVTVKVVPLHKSKLALPISVSGILSAKEEVKLSFKTGGVIEKIYFRPGQQVKKSQLLAHLNLAEIKARLTQAKSGFEKADRDLKRLKNLYADSVVTYEQLQNGTTALKVAESNLEIARFNYEYSSIHAPSNGKILKQLSEENELISPGMPLFIYGSYDGQWILKVGVADVDVVRLHLNDKARVQFDVYNDIFFEGEVTEIAAAANPMTGLFEIEVAISDQGKRLMSGFIGKVKLFPSEQKEVVLIPSTSLIGGQKLTASVYIPQGNGPAVKKVPVKIEQILNDQLAVSGEIENYDFVISDGAAYLYENSRIQIVD
ncbi:MAG: efflux RND transporter periplasmic adaptor subunit [Calditrichaceae bacterium]|nr:efflux RND transporter periplasmic adaptor subunit [Calditrichaceae bacterium]MBN2708317.1 efflux RND transporter periplasmic adaptor subunit [Calditrichaceae bacterium]RQV97228.1 MAG: efflux RND transporter periplasmic adaptor subunit [Calditrichota bacterium]